MIDLVNIKVCAGSGGNGAVSFYKLLNMKYGKPDGGDGGNGGSIYIESDESIFDLEPYRGRSLVRAENGTNGADNQKRGSDGKDIVLKVPVGTIANIKQIIAENRMNTRYEEKVGQNILLYDFCKPGLKILAARGGTGGRGNVHARGQKDRKGKKPEHWNQFNRAQKGRWGEETEAVMELKYIAQIGLVGLPNVGKSTLLSKLTNARPKIADYPFTTLEPNIGIMDYEAGSKKEKKHAVVADIPGLIEGASTGRGLGDKFLRHIERTELLAHVIDGTSGDIKKDYETVRNELKLYSKDLDKKKELIVINKIDMLTEEQINGLNKLFGRKKKILVSAETGMGVEELKKSIAGNV